MKIDPTMKLDAEGKRARAVRLRQQCLVLERFAAGEPLGDAEVRDAFRQVKRQRRCIRLVVLRAFTDAVGTMEARALWRALLVDGDARETEARDLAVGLRVNRLAERAREMTKLLDAVHNHRQRQHEAAVRETPFAA
jgi:hypothetical protein